MPNLLSRSKNEEFKSNSALQIRNQKERRAEEARKMKQCRRFWQAVKFRTLQKFCRVRNFLLCATVHPAFDILTFFCHFLFVSPICLHCNSACFDLLVILYWVLSIKDPRHDTVKDLILIINKI